uniref:Uncharacterized protein n=1 Tax=Arundo donax TaxID=35708 RepID=A0A0A9F2P1_ARUDO
MEDMGCDTEFSPEK